MPEQVLNIEKPGKSIYKSIPLYDYFFVLVLIIFAGYANEYIRVLSFQDYPGIFFFTAVITGILFLNHKVVFNKNFFLLLLFYFIYFLAVSIKYTSFHPSILINYFFKFFIVYITVKALKLRLLIIYEYLIYIFAVIALLMWFIQIALGGDTLLGFLSMIPGIDEFSHVTGGGVSAIVYTVQPTTASILYGFMPPRNCGFAWEPGGFAVYLCLAIFINLFMLEVNKNNRKRLLILILALLSSQSTTGFVILIVILLFYFYNKKLKTFILAFPVVLIGILLVFSLPFMSEKIIDLIQDANEIDIILEAGYGRESSITPQRFSSFVIALKDFAHDPVLGTGGSENARWTDRIGVNVTVISGIGTLLTDFGLVGFLFFIIQTLITSFYYSRQFKYKGGLLFFFVMMGIAISYGILEMPLIMSFWIFTLFESRNLVHTGPLMKPKKGLLMAR
jgi:hypothetical protein